jgi:hypothetical protein
MNPTQSDLHVNAPLTNISVAYIQSEDTYVADKVFPRVPVQKQSDLYWKYHKSEWRRQDVQRRAPSTETPGVGWNVTTDQYFAHVYGVHKDIDDQLRANADSNVQPGPLTRRSSSPTSSCSSGTRTGSDLLQVRCLGHRDHGCRRCPGAGQFLQLGRGRLGPDRGRDQGRHRPARAHRLRPEQAGDGTRVSCTRCATTRTSSTGSSTPSAGSSPRTCSRRCSGCRRSW